jgi:hypothetical protein
MYDIATWPYRNSTHKEIDRHLTLTSHNSVVLSTMLKAFEKSTVSIVKKQSLCCWLNTLLALCKVAYAPPDIQTWSWNSLRYLATSLPTPFIATLNNSRLHIVPTTIGRVTLSDFNNGVKGAEATNSDKLFRHLPPSHKLTAKWYHLKNHLPLQNFSNTLHLVSVGPTNYLDHMMFL